ncbi:hypothetical protein PA25_19450 [Pseudoalteromonas sp. A25]|uniref:hypothetical protein n=1 Tax=Pseudoalteromonas sp. A25 TaxID=116092 RepID=UPI001260FF75|nr:hypothetical protein [Pseudoalteromonas sp. A25]BBN81960.1 hypothetical protein PA25_19450 [Pseudoalteromonas sp. A25]
MQNIQTDIADNSKKRQNEQDAENICHQCVPLTSTVALKQAKQAQQMAALCAARSHAYQVEADGFALKYLAMLAQYGECHEYTVNAKTVWLKAREAIQARYPKS